MDGQGTRRRRKIAANFNRLSRVVHQCYRQTERRYHIANLNISSRSLKTDAADHQCSPWVLGIHLFWGQSLHLLWPCGTLSLHWCIFELYWGNKPERNRWTVTLKAVQPPNAKRLFCFGRTVKTYVIAITRESEGKVLKVVCGQRQMKYTL